MLGPMSALLVAAALAVSVAAGDVVPTSKIAPKKTSPARRVYDYVLTAGFLATMPPGGSEWDDRKIFELQAPNDITVQVYASNDAGSPMCLVRAPSGHGKIAQAIKLGLPVPVLLVDRGCTGQARDVRTYTESSENPGSRTRLTQRQLDIFFGLMEDCFKNGV